MSTRHTEGPWTTADDGTIEARHRGLVGHLTSASEGDRDLITAAPDLLGAVRAILFQVIQGPVLERDACIAQARAAYIKATGGQP